MTNDYLYHILNNVRSGDISVESALAQLKRLPYEEMGFAKVDHHRALRNGFPEVIYCQGKQTAQITKIMVELCSKNPNVLATRATREVYESITKVIPDAIYHELARLILVERKPLTRNGKILVMSAGTADLPVAEEAAITAEVLGNNVEKVYDVGVAGIHRLFANLDKMQDAQVIIIAAGMEGALASVVGGLVDVPVIAVPTSIGYGASFHGLAALLAMLNSCSAGIGVVNIDNGFGAGVLASSIVKVKEVK